MAGHFPCQLYTRGFNVNSRKEAGGIDDAGKIPQLCFFSYWAVTSDDCLSGPNSNEQLKQFYPAQ